MEMIGYCSTHLAQNFDHLLGGPLALVGFLEDVLAACLVVELAGRRIERDADLRRRACSRPW